MKIAIVAPPWFNVPPTTHGGIENFLHVLVEELVARGEEVTLYSVGTSQTSAILRESFPMEQKQCLYAPQHTTVESTHAIFAYEDISTQEFDIIHDNNGLSPGLLVGATINSRLKGPPILYTIHSEITKGKWPLYNLLSGFPKIFFNVVSHYQRTQINGLKIVSTIHNATNCAFYPFVCKKHNYLVSISRIVPEKGCHLAIELARRSGLPLKLAGRIEKTSEGRRYFEEQIEPYLNKNIEYVGEVNLQQKVELLSNARAFIFPVRWAEPFGLVAIEALACGTPVIAAPRGALPEIIQDGVDGFLADDVDEMLQALDRLDIINPKNCRRRVEEAFSPGVMVDNYLETYRRVLQESCISSHTK